MDRWMWGMLMLNPASSKIGFVVKTSAVNDLTYQALYAPATASGLIAYSPLCLLTETSLSE